jgi:hypothetical protein
MTHRSVLFPAPAVRSIKVHYQSKGLIGGLKDVRLPWIHNSDPLAFHSVRALLSKNHADVPLCRAFRTEF